MGVHTSLGVWELLQAHIQVLIPVLEHIQAHIQVQEHIQSHIQVQEHIQSPDLLNVQNITQPYFGEKNLCQKKSVNIFKI